MRRKSDAWLNATQILKVAGFDKPQRTRVLEREVQKGTHEKVQGGYGKYQGEFNRILLVVLSRSMEERGEKEEGRVSLKLGKRGIGQGLDCRDAFANYINPLQNCTDEVEVEERSFYASSRAFPTSLSNGPFYLLTNVTDIFFPLQVPGYLWKEE